MNAFTTLTHNGRLMFQAEHIINSFLRSETENHKVACFLVNPDGSRIAFQKGFKLENYEYVLCGGEIDSGIRPEAEWTLKEMREEQA